MEDIKSVEEKVEEKADEKGIKVITESGFEWEITAKMDDVRLVDAIAMAESEDEGTKLVGYREIRMFLLGYKGTKALYEHIKKTTGEDYIPVKKVNEEVTAIFEALGKQDEEIKNQLPQVKCTAAAKMN